MIMGRKILILLISSISGLALANGSSMNIETAKVTKRDTSVSISAYQHDTLCPDGGVSITAIGQYAVEIVTLYCLKPNEVKELITGLEKAQLKSTQLKSIK